MNESDKIFSEMIDEHLIDVDEVGDDILLEDYLKRRAIMEKMPQQFLPIGYMIITPIIEFDEGDYGDQIF